MPPGAMSSFKRIQALSPMSCSLLRKNSCLPGIINSSLQHARSAVRMLLKHLTRFSCTKLCAAQHRERLLSAVAS